MENIQEKIAQLDKKIADMRDYVEQISGRSIMSFNASLGQNYQNFADVKQRTYSTPEELKSEYFAGWNDRIEFIIARSKTIEAYKNLSENGEYNIFRLFTSDKKVEEYILTFFERTFYKKYKEYSRIKPQLDEILWIGTNTEIFGIGITPRFENGHWENDKSEVRKTKFNYWTIGHILNTGFLVADKNERILFDNVNEYLNFFVDFVAKYSGSPYESAVAEEYSQYVTNHSNPAEIPLLIPQFRYGGLDIKHKYRLDFMIINPHNQKKYGFELSPYSTHKSQKDYERDNEKSTAFQKTYGIIYNAFTDRQLKDIALLFNEMKAYLVFKPSYQAVCDMNSDKLKQLAAKIIL